MSDKYTVETGEYDYPPKKPLRDRFRDPVKEQIDQDRHKRRLWWVWAIFLAVGVTLELLAIYTDEKDLPTFSRFFWMLKDNWPWLAIPTVILMGWAIVHLNGGECAFGLC